MNYIKYKVTVPVITGNPDGLRTLWAPLEDLAESNLIRTEYISGSMVRMPWGNSGFAISRFLI